MDSSATTDLITSAIASTGFHALSILGLVVSITAALFVFSWGWNAVRGAFESGDPLWRVRLKRANRSFAGQIDNDEISRRGDKVQTSTYFLNR